jgi:hypothetical protein
MDPVIIIGIIIAIIIVIVAYYRSMPPEIPASHSGPAIVETTIPPVEATIPPAPSDVVTRAREKVKYVIIEVPSLLDANKKGTNFISLAEIYIYDENDNVIPSKGEQILTNTKYDSTKYKPSYLVDGNEKTIFTTSADTVYGYHFVRIELIEPVRVTKIKIINGPEDGHKFANSNIKLYDAAGKLLFERDTKSGEGRDYTIGVS